MILARNNSTPVSYWLELPLVDLRSWIKVNNIVEEERRRRTDGG